MVPEQHDQADTKISIEEFLSGGLDRVYFGGVEIRYPQRVCNCLPDGDRMLLQLNDEDFDDERLAQHNVVCVGTDGRELWRAEPLGLGVRRSRSGRRLRDSYAGIMIEGGLYFGWNTDEYVFLIDRDTGDTSYYGDRHDLMQLLAGPPDPPPKSNRWRRRIERWLNALTMSPRDRFR